MRHVSANLRVSVILVASLLSFLNAETFAANSNDSIKSKELNELLVKGSYRTQKGDTLNVVPSAEQRKFSFTGYELLRNIMLPGLRVNTVTGDISLSGGGTAMVLIDGRPVDKQNILAVRAKEVARVEYLQDPGADYGFDESIGAVINIIMKKRNDGYAAAVVTNNAVTTANGENFAFGKYTNNNSEYQLSVNSAYTSLSKRRVDNNDTYFFNDQPHNIFYKGMNTHLQYTSNTVQAQFNNYQVGKQIIDVSLRGVFYYSPHRAHAQYVTEDGMSPYYQLTEPYEKNWSPQLNVYYKRFFTKTSSLTANFVGSYRHTDFHRTIQQSETDNFDNLSYDYSYGTKSNRQSYILEVKYQNKFNRKFNLNVGARGAFSHTASDYFGDATSFDKMNSTNLYAYALASGYLGKIQYMAGMGLSGWLMSQNGEHLNRFMPRPQLQLTYKLKGWRFRLNGSMLHSSPSLSEMAQTESRINKYEIRMGNQDLKDWWRYRAALRISKTFGILGIQNNFSYVNSHKPVMSSIFRTQRGDETLFIHTFENQKRFTEISDNLNLELAVSNHLNISAGVNFNAYQSRGLDYSHHLNDWNFNVNADWFSGNWNAGIFWRSRQRSLSGETVSSTGTSNTIYVNYIIGNSWRFGVMALNLFCKNGPTYRDQINSRYMSQDETIVVPAQRNMIMITAAWNFSTGKQRKGVNIDMTNEDTETGVFK